MTAPDRLWSTREVIDRTAALFGLDRDAMMSRDQHRTPSLARQVAYFVIRVRLRHSLPEIARTFDRDHTTVRHGIQRIGDLRDPAKVTPMRRARLHPEVRWALEQVDVILSEWPSL